MKKLIITMLATFLLFSLVANFVKADIVYYYEPGNYYDNYYGYHYDNYYGYQCYPGSTKDRYCSGYSQVQYYVCNSDGNGWYAIVEICPYGSVCSNGYCNYQQPYYPCSEGYTGNYQCSGNWKQGEYRRSNCGTEWRNVEYCSSSCSNGQCVTPSCSEGYLDDFQCNGNWIQKEYQYANCNIVWQNYEYCQYGCSGGSCTSQPQLCTPQYFDSYRCSNSWRQQMYQSSDCSISWVNIQYCSNSCYGDTCYTAEPCSLSASASTPDDAYINDEISTTVRFSNSGDIGGWISFHAYVCRSDGTNCELMGCEDGHDPSFHIDSRDTESFTCTKTADEESWHKIKVEYSGCGGWWYDPAVYSGRFDVFNGPRCTPGFSDTYRCFGNWRQRQYQFSDCRTEWKNVEYCSDSCSNNVCVTKPKDGTPKVFVKDEYDVGACKSNEIYFDVTNVGEVADTFTISYSGAASSWMRSTSSIYLNAGEKKTVTAYVDVPCDASDLQGFDVKVSNSETASATSFFKVSNLNPFTGWTIKWGGATWDIVVWGLIFLLFVGLLLILVLFFFWALGGRESRGSGRYGRGTPEGFNYFKSNNVRKRPESFKLWY